MRIMYCIAGEGRGHAFRTIPIYKYLMQQGHTVDLFAGDVSFDILKKYNVRRISSLRIAYNNNSVNDIKSVLKNVFRIPEHIMSIQKIAKYIIKEKPDVLINDFETFSNYIAKIFGVPIITVDNGSIITSAKCAVPIKFKINAAKVKFVVSVLSPFASIRLIPTFFYPKNKNISAVYVPPVIRKEIIVSKPKVKSHILVYQTSRTNHALIKSLRCFPFTKFILYGFEINKQAGNIEFVGHDQERFLRDLRDCNAVITNGGFTLMTEALALRKPILSLPVIGQFEQVLNALYLARLGFGMCSFSTNPLVIKNFLNQKERFRKKLCTFPKHSNKPFFDALDNALKKYVN